MSAPTKPTIGEIAARIPAHMAQRAVADIFATIGMEGEWDSGTIERVLDCLGELQPHLGFTRLDLSGDGDIPNPFSTEEAACSFWLTIEED